MDVATAIKTLLGGRRAADFVELPREERSAAYNAHLVLAHDIIIGDEKAVGSKNDLLERYDPRPYSPVWQILREALKVYYSKNTFVVASHLLRQFVALPSGINTPIDVASLIQKIVVTADLEKGGDNVANLADDLQLLLAFDQAISISVKLRGWGPLNGSDLTTQLKIKDGTVKRELFIIR